MASANILKLQKEQKNAQKAKMIKQQQRRTSASRRTPVGSIKKMTMQKAHKDDFSSRMAQRCFRARTFTGA
jgi:hypothetical protein